MGPKKKIIFGDEMGGGSAFGDKPESFGSSRVAQRRLAPAVARQISIGHWQSERTEILQRACLRIEDARARGILVKRAARRESRRYHKRPYRYDPKRRIHLAVGTLLGVYHRWRKAGCKPAAFRLHYRGSATVVFAPVLCRFVAFCSEIYSSNFTTAWKRFSERGGCFGLGRRYREKRRLPFSLSQARRHFPIAKFRTLQTLLEQKTAKERQLSQQRLQFISEIRVRVPDRPNNKSQSRFSRDERVIQK